MIVASELPPRVETTDKDGITTVVEYKINEQGKRVKVTRKIKRTLVKSTVNHVVADRMNNWAKFGLEKGKKAGPDTATTTVGENIRLRLTPGGARNKEGDDKDGGAGTEEDEQAKIKAQLATKKITCRLCQGDHYTTRCPYKDTLGSVLGGGDPDAPPGTDDPAAGLGPNATASDIRAAGGKYVPPSMREGARRGPGESMTMRGNRDDLPTLRVTNLSEDTTEDDLWDLFSRATAGARIQRIYVGKDQETGLCKGFAFVSFEDRAVAERAMKKINGLPYDHLILNCTWSVPKAPTAA